MMRNRASSTATAPTPRLGLLAALVPVLVVIAALWPQAGAAKTPEQIATAAARGVVSITSTFTQQTGPFGEERESVAAGSGFVLDRAGHIVTSEHVIDDATGVHVAFADGTKVRARVVGSDPLLDLAVLEVDVKASALHPLALGFAENARLGQPVVAIGNPFGLDRSISTGIVSGLRRQIVAPNGFTLSNAIQTDAAVNHGNSGGPLLDGRGRVIGVNAQIAESGVDANVGVAFAVAVDGTARKAIRAMAAGRTVSHAWLGVSLDDVDAILATSGRVRSTFGALITGIVPNGPAADAGIRGGSTTASVSGVQYCLGGDIVIAVAGRKVVDSGALQIAILRYAPGTRVRFTVVRAGGTRTTLTVRLGTQPTTAPQATTGCG